MACAASIDRGAHMTSEMLDQAWGLSDSVSLRPEPFGALAYHFGNRRLTFLKRKELVAVVTGLADSPDVRGALIGADVPLEHWPAYVTALEGLAAADMIHPRTPMGDAI